MGGEADEVYYVAILDPKTREVIGDEKKFQTLEAVLGFLHKVEEEGNRERLLTCLMGLRDGESEVVIFREQFHAGNQILRIGPPKRFHELFWRGFGLKFTDEKES